MANTVLLLVPLIASLLQADSIHARFDGSMLLHLVSDYGAMRNHGAELFRGGKGKLVSYQVYVDHGGFSWL